jgi:hypothetical protein
MNVSTAQDPVEPRIHQDAHPSGEGRVHTVAIMMVAVLLRLLVSFIVLNKYPSGWIYTRGIEMKLLAESLLAGQGLSSPFGVPTGPTAFFSPVYSILVACVFRIFGIESLASAIVLIFAQILVNLVTLWLILRLCRQLFDARSANLAGFFWACSPPLLWVPAFLWETSLSISFMAGLLVLALRCTRRPTLLVWIGFGAFCGLTALTNPALLPSFIAVYAWSIYRTRRINLFAPVFGLLVFVVVLSPWPIRNARLFHTFVPTRTSMGYELWQGNRPGSNGFFEDSLFPTFSAPELADYKSRGEIAYASHKSELTREYIEAHPREFLQVTMRRVVRFWAGTGNRGGSPFFPLHALTTTLLGFIGLGLLFRRRRLALAFLFLLPLALFPLPYYITHADFRFRIVIDPLITPLAAFAVSQFVQRYRSYRASRRPLPQMISTPHGYSGISFLSCP